ncbi:MAG TPA: hypothetical protein PLM33_12635 [Acidobacteriota bacterium]|nr:hypothetical protein [Acidobacteriota bacterium]
MRLSARSYPHPVLGNRDDVPGAGFQAALEMSADKECIYIAADVTCSCETLNALLNDGRAAYVLHVECSNTLFRRAYEFREPHHRISIGADNLNDAVEVNVFVRATDRIGGYRLPEAHPDYADAAFDIQRGDILAVGEGQVFYVESDFDSLSRIGSIMQINESPKDGDIPMEPDFNGDKIVIFLSKNDFAEYKVLKLHEGVRDPLATIIVLPVLVEAINILMKESDGLEDTRRWVRALARRIESLGLNRESPPLLLAQKLLELPVKRALSSSRMLVERGGS